MHYAYRDGKLKETDRDRLFIQTFWKSYEYYLKIFWGKSLSKETMPDTAPKGLFPIILKLRAHADRCLMEYTDYIDTFLLSWAVCESVNYKDIFNNPLQAKLYIEDVAC